MRQRWDICKNQLQFYLISDIHQCGQWQIRSLGAIFPASILCWTCPSFLNFSNYQQILIQNSINMSTTSYEATKRKIEELKRIRQQQNQRNRANQPTEATTRAQQPTKRSYSFQKSEDIHIAGTLVETYDMQIQCALETRSLDSKAHKQIQNEDKSIDLLQPREHKRRNQGKKEEHMARQVHELSGEQLDSLVKSKHFTDFFNKSSKFLEKVLDHGDGDMIELLLRDGIKSKNRSGHDILVHSVTLADPNSTGNRVVTDIDWSDQIKDVFCASYSHNEEGSIKDHVGLVLVWNPLLKNRPEFQCYAQSAVTSTKFFPFANNTILGGCYNGQILMWDIRAKSMPSQRSGISADAHKYPVNSLSVIGTQIANNIASFSNDGMMCVWDIKQFSKPIRVSKLSAPRPVKVPKPSGLAASSILAGRTLRPEQSTSSILDRTTKEETHDINITCCQFPSGDANNYYIGSLNGVLYKNALHNKSTEKIVLYDEHNGPISSVSVNYPSEYEALTGLVLTSSFDWTVKLWSPNSKDSLRTFQNSQDYIYDAAWNTKNPSLFATVNNEGYLDIFDLTRDMELPIAHQKVNNNAQNKCKWHADGALIVSGDSTGNLNVYVLAEKYRKMDGSKYDDFVRYIYQNKEEI